MNIGELKMKEELNLNTRKSGIKILMIALMLVLFSCAIFLASCSIGNLTITYTAIDGEKIELTYKKGIKIGEIDEAKYVVGYSFEGWYKDSSLYVKYSDDAVIENSTTIYPKYTANKYQVTFYSNNEKNEKDVRVYAYNSTFKLPIRISFTNDYKDFVGWSKNKDDVAGSSTVLAPGTEVQLTTEGAAYYAIWDGIPINVTYDFSTGRLNDQEIDTTSFAARAIFGKEFTLPELLGTLRMDGDIYGDYVLKGLKINGVLYTPGQKITIGASHITKDEEDRDVIAISMEWQLTNEGTASFDLNKPDNDQKDISVANITVTKNDEGKFVFTLPNCANLYGHTFLGWKLNPEDEEMLAVDSTYETEHGLTTFYAVWEAQGRTITLNDNGVIEIISNKFYGDKVTLTNAHNPTGEYVDTDKWEFIGWKLEIDGQETRIYSGEITILFTSDECENGGIILYGAYKRKQVTVEFSANGGNGSIEDELVNTCETYVIPEALYSGLSRQYYTLSGFSTDPDAVTGDYEITIGTEGVTLYAIWVRNKVTITFAASSPDETVPASIQVDEGSNYKLTRTGFAKTGYEVVGFKIDEDEEEKIYEVGEQLFITENITLIPQWSILERINFRGAGEITSLTKTDGTPTTIESLNVGDVIILPAYAPDEENVKHSYRDIDSKRYYFAGWSTDEEATYPTYFANTAYEITENFDVLYAIYMPATTGLSYSLGTDGTASVYYNGGNLSTNNILVYPNTYTAGGVEYKVTKLLNRFSSSSKPTDVRHVIIPEGIEAIGDNSFRDCGYLTDILVPKTVSRIGGHALRGTNISYINVPQGSSLAELGEYAFYNCESLVNIIYPANSLKQIGEYAFAYCANLVKADLPLSTEVISTGAFYNCSRLASVTIPRSLTKIETQAFEGCSLLVEVNFEANSNLKTIGASAFLNCFSLGSINLGDRVEAIGKNAFEGCLALTNVTFKSALKTIGEKAFYNCSNLQAIVFDPSTVNLTIGASAFESCSKLTALNLPETVQSIGNFAFRGCNRLVEITFLTNAAERSNRAYIAIGNCLIEKATNTLILGCKNSELTLQALNEITNEIAGGITRIADYAFHGCTGLESFAIPNTVLNIGAYAFSQNINLSQLTIGENSSLRTIGNYAFNGCSSLTSLFIPKYLNVIGENAFYNCGSLATVTFDAESTSITIGTRAFYNCASLSSITIPGTMNNIGAYAFTGCSSLYSVTFLDVSGWAAGTVMLSEDDLLNATTAANYLTRKYTSEAWSKPTNFLQFTLLPDDTYEVELRGLTESYSIGGAIVIPSTYQNKAVTQIKTRGFAEAELLTSISIPSSVKIIGTEAFIGSTNLIKVNLSEGIETIGVKAFENTGLKSVVIPNSVITILSRAFYGCPNLRTATLSNGITSIEESTFAGCTKLTSITVPNSVTIIKSQAFSGDSALKTVSLGSMLDTIAGNAFFGCTAISTVKFNDVNGWKAGTTNFVGADLNNTSTAATKLKNFSSLEWQKVLTNYLQFTQKLDGTYSVGAIDPARIFGNITIPSSYNSADVTEIDTAGFAQGTEITGVTIPSTVTTIGSYAFAGCNKIKTIDLGSVQTIGENAFDGCTMIQEFNLPAQLNSIGANAFANIGSTPTITFANPNGWAANGAIDPAELVDDLIAKSYLTGSKQTSTWTQNITTYLLFTEITDTSSSDVGNYTVSANLTNIYGTIIIPGTYNNKKVVKIDDLAFNGCTNLQKIIIEDNVKAIGTSAFEGCTSLETAVLANTITSLGASCFAHCSSLANVNIPAQTYTIGEQAFYYDTSLTSIYIPKKVNQIKASAFANCEGLQSVTFETGSQLVKISENAFRNCSGLTTFVIPAEVVSIEPNAFAGCTGLVSVTFEEIFPWSAGSYEIPNLVLLSQTTAATYLTDTYVNVVWRKRVIVAPIQNGGTFVTEGFYDGSEWYSEGFYAEEDWDWNFYRAYLNRPDRCLGPGHENELPAVSLWEIDYYDNCVQNIEDWSWDED